MRSSVATRVNPRAAVSAHSVRCIPVAVSLYCGVGVGQGEGRVCVCVCVYILEFCKSGQVVWRHDIGAYIGLLYRLLTGTGGISVRG